MRLGAQLAGRLIGRAWRGGGGHRARHEGAQSGGERLQEGDFAAGHNFALYGFIADYYGTRKCWNWPDTTQRK